MLVVLDSIITSIKGLKQFSSTLWPKTWSKCTWLKFLFACPKHVQAHLPRFSLWLRWICYLQSDQKWRWAPRVKFSFRFSEQTNHHLAQYQKHLRWLDRHLQPKWGDWIAFCNGVNTIDGTLLITLMLKLWVYSPLSCQLEQEHFPSTAPLQLQVRQHLRRLDHQSVCTFTVGPWSKVTCTTQGAYVPLSSCADVPAKQNRGYAGQIDFR